MSQIRNVGLGDIHPSDGRWKAAGRVPESDAWSMRIVRACRATDCPRQHRKDCDVDVLPSCVLSGGHVVCLKTH